MSVGRIFSLCICINVRGKDIFSLLLHYNQMHTHTQSYLSLCIYKYRQLLSSRSKAVCVVGAVQGRNSVTENSCCILVPPLAPRRNKMLLISRQ